VQLVADRTSVGPRLLLAALEYRAGWVTQDGGSDNAYPMDLIQVGREGLYRQLEWAANQINRGYYARADAGITNFVIADGTSVSFAPDINHGTAGVQTWLGAHSGATYSNWLVETSADGFIRTFEALFGNPFRYTYEPLFPEGVSQPLMTLPWRNGESWYFTGGPHGAWASGSAWAALDFAPQSDQIGCYEAEQLLVAVADGVIARSNNGHVVLDLDGDGFAGTGWAVHYGHVDGRDRIAPGTRVKAGDPIGHPGCEGGVSNGTHLHIARSFNGRWVPADGALPFNMDGWESSGYGVEYDGYLTRAGVQKEACICKDEINTLTRDE
jgi:murein DD-endopeptidase MepM/ murein hydrolase activator NlpD